MRNKIFMLATLAVSLLMASCEDDYKVYDTNQTDSVFFNYLNEKQTADSVITYSFDYDIAQSHVVEIPVSLMGIPKSEARSIELTVVKDSTDMVEGVNYTIERAEMAANEVSDTIKIKLLRDKDPEILTKEKKLRIAIVDNGHLPDRIPLPLSIPTSIPTVRNGGQRSIRSQFTVMRMPSCSLSISMSWRQRQTRRYLTR